VAELISTLSAAISGSFPPFTADMTDTVADRIDALLPQTQCRQCGYPGQKRRNELAGQRTNRQARRGLRQRTHDEHGSAPRAIRAVVSFREEVFPQTRNA